MNDIYSCLIQCIIGFGAVRLLAHCVKVSTWIKLICGFGIGAIFILYHFTQRPENYFEILGVEYSLYLSRSKFRELKHFIAKTYHPDKNGGSNEMFQIASKALNTIFNPDVIDEYLLFGDYSDVDIKLLGRRGIILQSFLFWLVAIFIACILTFYISLNRIADYKSHSVKRAFSTARFFFITLATASFSIECRMRFEVSEASYLNSLTPFEIIGLMKKCFPAVSCIILTILLSAPWLLGADVEANDAQHYYLGGILTSNSLLKLTLEEASSNLSNIKKVTKSNGYSLDVTATIDYLSQGNAAVSKDAKTGRRQVVPELSNSSPQEAFRMLWGSLSGSDRIYLKNRILHVVDSMLEERKTEILKLTETPDKVQSINEKKNNSFPICQDGYDKEFTSENNIETIPLTETFEEKSQNGEGTPMKRRRSIAKKRK